MSELLMADGAGERRLTALQFQELATVPAAVEWFANIRNPRTRRAYQADLRDLFTSGVDHKIFGTSIALDQLGHWWQTFQLQQADPQTIVAFNQIESGAGTGTVQPSAVVNSHFQSFHGLIPYTRASLWWPLKAISRSRPQHELCAMKTG